MSERDYVPGVEDDPDHGSSGAHQWHPREGAGGGPQTVKDGRLDVDENWPP